MSSFLVAHLVYKFDIGGLESVIVEMINSMPEDSICHAIIGLTYCSDEFANRIAKNNVKFYSLGKKEGNDIWAYIKLFKILHAIRPRIVHTYSIGALEYQICSFLVGVKGRIHAEHGRSFLDLHGTNRKHNMLRKLINPFITKWVPVSDDLRVWLHKQIGISEKKIELIYNGIDTKKFQPGEYYPRYPQGFLDNDQIIFGHVGRLDPVKNQKSLLVGFKELNELCSNQKKIRLVIVGDGPLKDELKNVARELDIEKKVWFTGARNDIAELLRSFHVFVLPSLAEGIPMTIIEAMATGLPVIATRVGGNSEVVIHDTTGITIPPGDINGLVDAMRKYVDNPEMRKIHGQEGRKRVLEHFSVAQMTKKYLKEYGRYF